MINFEQLPEYGMPTSIKFCTKKDPYWEFSNFFVVPIVVDGVEWAVGTEAFYQAMKAADPDVQEYVRTKLTTPREVKDYCAKIELRPDWDATVGTEALRDMFRDDQGVILERVKDHFMFQGLVAKFTQHSGLGDLLLGTGNATIIENSKRDAYWGNGPTGAGLNKLGRMLMLVRKNLARIRAQ